MYCVPNSLAVYNDEKFLTAFRNGSLAAEHFRHADHIRLARLYLLEYPMPRVLIRFTRDLKNFAHSKGAPDLYHESITWAFLFLIHERMKPKQSWTDFANRNPDLFEKGVLERYYPNGELSTDKAKQQFLMPSIR